MFSRQNAMEQRLIDNCQRLFNRNQEQLQECLTNATNIYHTGLEDLSQTVFILQKHREDTRRMFIINRQADLKHCQVVFACAC